jgi:WD40 repeat protein
MPQTTRTFRIFISSTFSDLKEERNALQKYVFPRLRELAMEHGCRFQAIDLRWGVSEEAALDQQTMKICLAEIERCQKVSPRPNFIILLGDRYGWRPLPYAIPANEFEKIIPLIKPAEQDQLRWKEEQVEDQKGWYRLDTNSVPPEYVLQPRQHGSKFEDYSIWVSEVERPLVAALEKAALQVSLDEEALVKYTLSATGQEIAHGAMKVKDAQEHVFGFFRSIENSGTPLTSRGGNTFIESDPDSQYRQHSLRTKLNEYLPKNIYQYKAILNESGVSEDHIGTLPETLEDCLKLRESSFAPKNLCVDVWLRLSHIIIDEMNKLESVGALEREQQAHAEFRNDRAKFFMGREELLARIADYISGKDTHPLILWGESGSGKSALMAKAVIEQRKTPDGKPTTHPDPTLIQSDFPRKWAFLKRLFPPKFGEGNQAKNTIVSRFIGATPESSTGRDLLESLCRQLTHEYGGDESNLPQDYERLVLEFPRRLAKAAQKKAIILFLDGFDQLSDNPGSISWLPTDLPLNVKLVVSMLPGDGWKILQNKLPATSFLMITPMDAQVGNELLDCWLEEANRTLTPEQRRDIMGKFEAGGGLPLYLKLAFKESKNWHAYDGLPKLSDQDPGLSKDIPGIIQDLFWRLERESNHGKALVSHALGYLSAAKNGLTEDELLDVLWLDEKVRKDFFRRSPKSPQEITSLPVVIWARLFLDLEPYLTFRKAQGTELMAFYHSQVAGAVRAAYLQRDRHEELAVYFDHQPFYLHLQSANLRKLNEIIYQQVMAQMWKQAKNTLTDFNFMEARCKECSVYDLLKDYHLVLEHWKEKNEDRQTIFDFEYRLARESHKINQVPNLLFPLLYNHLTWLDAPEGPVHHLCEEARDGRNHYLRSILDAKPPLPPSLYSLESHTKIVNSVVVTPDGQQIISGSADDTIKIWDLASGQLLRSLRSGQHGVTSVAVTPNGRQVVSAGYKTIRVWDLTSGQLLRSMDGHTDVVNSVAVTPDGQQIVSGSKDKTIKVWDLASGQQLRSMEGHADRVYAVAVTPDGQKIVSGGGKLVSWDENGTLEVWDLASGRLLRSFEGHTEAVLSVTVTRDGRQIVSGSNDKTIKVWDLASGLELHSHQGHAKFVKFVVVTPDGQQIVSASDDNTIKVWDLASGRQLHSMECHAERVNSVAVSPDGQQIISGGGDIFFGNLNGTIEVRDLLSGRLLHSLGGHTSVINSLAVSLDGQQFVSGSSDRSVKVWELADGRLLRSLEGHTEAVISVAVSPDGQQILSGSYGIINVWNSGDGQLLRSLEGHTSWVNSLAVTPDGQLTISASQDKTIKVWDLASGQQLRSLEGHTWPVNSVAVTPDGQQIVSGSDDKTIKVWDLSSSQQLRSLEGHIWQVTSVVVTPDGQQIVSGSKDKTIKVWDLANGQVLRSLEGHNDAVISVAVTRDGEQIISGSMDRTIKIWELSSGQLLGSLEWHISPVRVVAVTPNGKQIVSGLEDSSIKVWNLAREKIVPTIRDRWHVTSMVMVPNVPKIFSMGWDHAIKVWELPGGKLLNTLESHKHHSQCFTVTSDGNKIVTGLGGGTIRVWDLESGQLLRSLEGHISGVNTVAVTSDGKQIISGAEDKIIKVWDLESGQLLRSFRGHEEEVGTVLVTPNGQRIVSMGKLYGTIKVWNMASGRVVHSQEEYNHSGTRCIAVTPDGNRIISGEEGGRIKVWDLETGRLLHLLEGLKMGVLSVTGTPDGRQIFAATRDGTIRLWDIEENRSQVLFWIDAAIGCMALSADGRYLCCSDSDERAWIFEWVGVTPVSTLPK